MPTIELIYDPDCPNVHGAREHLRRALVDVGLRSRWQEWNRSGLESPAYVRAYGSPTILVDGHDVAGASPSEGANSCRVYTDKDGQLQGVPSVEVIVSKLNGMTPATDRGGWRGIQRGSS